LFIRQDFDITTFTEGIIVSFILVGAMVGAFSGGPLSDRIGRRPPRCSPPSSSGRFTILAVRIIDRVGRRPLLLIGLVGMTISLGLLAVVFTTGGENVSASLAILATVCLALYIASFAISLGPVFWLMISEIYPLRIRGTAMSVASIANWGSNFIVALMFPVLLAALGGATLFWLFAAIGIAAWIFIYFRVPETKNRTLEEIEASFRGTTVGPSRVQ
jgi:MFS family permease